MPPYSIRRAGGQDCAEIARLADQLGYPAAEDAMRGRLERLLASPNDAIFVAELDNGGLAGWIHGALSQYLESEYRVEICGLIVDEKFQRQGIGRGLVEHIERWAAERGVKQVSVRCQTKRAEAHQFYQSMGYRETKTQIVFRKPLP